MKAKPNEVGRVVVSLKGHDEGRWFAIVKVLDDPYVLICDGDTRRLDKPKKKQAKHLRALPMTVCVTGKGASGGELDDSDLRKSLKQAKMQYQTQFDGGRKSDGQVKEECAFVQRGCH